MGLTEEAEVLITFEKKPSQEEADICYSKLAINNVAMRIGRCYRFAWMRNQELYQIVKMQRSIENL